MCNLYRHETSPHGIAVFLKPTSLGLSDAARARNLESGYTGADQDGTVLVNSGQGELDFAYMRWGFPPVRDGAKPITNIRNLASNWWMGANGAYLTEAEYRCLVPFAAFAEWSMGDKANAWFAIDSDAPMFAGVWRPWYGERLMSVEGKSRRERRDADWKLYAFLTTEPNAVVAPIHPKAMPVILRTPDDCERWMSGGKATLDLQRPLDARYVTRLESESR